MQAITLALIAPATLALTGPTILGAQAPGPFLVQPYLQLGDAPTQADHLDLMWQTPDREESWSVEFRCEGEKAWRKAQTPAIVRVTALPLGAHRVYRTTLGPLKPGAIFEYRVNLGAMSVFEAKGKARRAPGQAQRVAIMGDIAMKGPAEKAVAYQVFLQKPDSVVIPGDIVYPAGRASEYREVFFPVYNADTASPETGAPLLRSTYWASVLGNHDAQQWAKAKHPDALAYFYYWSQPLNGPNLNAGGPHTPELVPAKDWQGFLETAGPRFPRMANFSFDSGDVHWTMLDANPYVHWEDPALQSWLEKDLESSKSALWHLVVFHQQGFHSSNSHAKDQWMRILSPLFEKHHVDLVIGATSTTTSAPHHCGSSQNQRP